MPPRFAWPRQLRRRLFPPSFRLQAAQSLLLRDLFPSLDWSKVRFYDGMPWFMQHSFAIATVLPSDYRRGGVDVYLRCTEHTNFEDLQALCTLVHEAFHILQYQDTQSLKPRYTQWGFFRPFLRLYIAYYLQGLFHNFIRKGQPWSQASYEAYRQHPMEVPAYDFEYEFAAAYYDYCRAPDLPQFFSLYPELRKIDSKADLQEKPAFWAQALASTLLFLVLLCKPLLELPLYLVYGLSRLFG